VSLLYNYELKITNYAAVINEENNETIIITPQMILIHFANHFTLPDWINSKMPHRMLVMMESILIPIKAVIRYPTRKLTELGFASTILTVTIDPMMDKKSMIAHIRLITFANFLCVIASLMRRIAPRTDPTMRIMPKSIAKVEIAITDDVVDVIDMNL
jgi:hypothetical protein